MRKREAREDVKAVLMLLPIIIPLCIFWIYPLFKTVFLSLTDWDYISPAYNIVGLENYKTVITSDYFYKVLKNTIIFTTGTVIIPIILGLFIASHLNNITKWKDLFLTGIFSSWLTPAVVISMVWVEIFKKDNGIVNRIIQLFGGKEIAWLGGNKTAMIVVIIVTSWQYIGLAVLLLSSAMSKLEQSVEEAAQLDGAKGLNKFFKITLPAISPTVFFLIIMFLSDSLKAYDQIHILTQGGPAGATSTLLYYFFVAAFEWFETGTAATIAVIILAISILISGINFLYSKRWVRY